MGAIGQGPGLLGRRLGDFTIEHELGRGGMGVVYRARQESMGGRRVALKVLPSFIGLDDESVARFRREAEAAGRLSHPGIVPVYAVGEQDGVHWFAMELVDGPSLASLLTSLAGRSPERLLGTIAEETALDQVYPGLRETSGGSLLPGSRYARSCAHMIADVADALTVAHAGRIIHRDVKPSNILIHHTGRPVLVDFGLARDEQTHGLTQSGDALGTPSYMAPEQACGRSDLDARVDIYGLGATLYEMLTLRPPFDGAHPGEIMRKILEEAPTSIRQINPRVPVDLVTVVENCLAKQPDERYPAVESLAMDLRAFLSGRPVAARKPGVRLKTWRLIARHRLSAAVGTVVLCVSLAAFVLMGWIERRRALESAREALGGARDHLSSLRFDGATADYGRAAALLSESELLEARKAHMADLFESVYAKADHDELRRYLETWAPSQRDEDWLALYRRVLGHGRIRVEPAIGNGVAVRVRHLDPDGGGLGGWCDYQPGRDLPTGSYLIDIESVGRARAVHAVTVERDRATVVRPLRIPIGIVPEETVLVAGAAPEDARFVDRTELDRKSYARVLQRLRDQRLVDELLPQGWGGPVAPVGEEGLPVVGISFAQARTVAALRGAHLLSPDEYALAATSGLDALDWPWGTTFDWSAVAASEDGLPEPQPAGSLPQSASPVGILHLVGNVEEILAPPPSDPGVPTLAGGHYQSDVEQLTLRAARPIRELYVPLPLAGFRTARFVVPPTDEAARAAARTLEEETLGAGSAGLLHDWRIDSTGSVRLSLHLSGIHVRDRREIHLALSTDGFLPRTLAVRDGFDNPMSILQRTDRRSTAELRVDLGGAVRAGQNYRLRIDARLVPISGLFGRFDAYSLHFPMKVTGQIRSVHRLELPPGSRVDDVEPVPTLRYFEDGKPILVWDHPPDGRGSRTLPAALRFRKDGPLTERWPLREEAEAISARLFDALKNDDRSALGMLLSEQFTLAPHDYSKDDLVGPDAEPLGDSFDSPQFLDVTAVGPIVTVWATVDWMLRRRTNEQDRIERWPVRLQIERRPGGPVVLGLEPAGRADSGRVIGGVYRHDDLRVTVEPPPGIDLHRQRGQLTELQIECTPRQVVAGLPSGSLAFSVVGYRAEAGSREEHVLQKLSTGAFSARPGRCVADDRQVFGTRESGVDARVLEWMFGTPLDGEFGYERWIHVSQGRRKLLIRMIARGSSRSEAAERFRSEPAQVFFSAMSRALQIQ